MPSTKDEGRAAISRIIRTTREIKAMSQAELARQAGCSTKTVYNLELGGRWPSNRTLRGIERALGFRITSIDQALESEHPEWVTLEDLSDKPAEDETELAMSDFSNLDVATEFLRRMDRLQAELDAVTKERDALRAKLGTLATGKPAG